VSQAPPGHWGLCLYSEIMAVSVVEWAVQLKASGAVQHADLLHGVSWCRPVMTLSSVTKHASWSRSDAFHLSVWRLGARGTATKTVVVSGDRSAQHLAGPRISQCFLHMPVVSLKILSHPDVEDQFYESEGQSSSRFHPACTLDMGESAGSSNVAVAPRLTVLSMVSRCKSAACSTCGAVRLATLPRLHDQKGVRLCLCRRLLMERPGAPCLLVNMELKIACRGGLWSVTLYPGLCRREMVSVAKTRCTML